MTNLVPNRYRGVSVAALPPEVGLDEVALEEHFLGREAYRRTRFVVARNGSDTALLHVTRVSEMALFSAITSVELLAGPDDCRYVVAPEADTGIPSELARVAREQAPGIRAVAVQGRYAHVNIIVDPQPLRVVVHEVVPPEPAKLLDQARRVLAVAAELPPIELVGDLTDLAVMASSRPSEHYLLPCRGSGGAVPGAEVSFLDEHPPRADWTLLGCARSQQIHRHFYGEDPPTVDFCPRKRAVALSGAPAERASALSGASAERASALSGAPAERASMPGTRLLTKCCLQEEHVESGDGWVSVPWGSSLDHVREALTRLVAQEEPAWAPV